MGRYYKGDIEGKFWFGVQSSDDASFFGGCESEPNYINYSFSRDDMPSVLDGIEKCKEKLGKNKEILDTFSKEYKTFTGEMIYEYFKDKHGIELKVEWLERGDGSKYIFSGGGEIKELLTWYARFELGEKIKKCIEEQDYCEFEAEL